MEILPNLQSLYRHWGEYSQVRHYPNLPASVDMDLLRQIQDFASERMRIWEQKTTGQQRPYTSDPILHNYRFCNIYRELDHQTVEIHTQLAPLRQDLELWLLNLAFHRFICRPQTVQAVGNLSFNPQHNQAVMQDLQQLPRPKYGTAYVFPISVIQRSNYPTREEFFCLYLPQAIPKIAASLIRLRKATVQETLDKLLPLFGFNFRFHWTEILIDVAYQFPELIDLYRDFYIGPGASPTLTKLANGADPQALLNALPGVEMPGFPHLTFQGQPVNLSAENWEGIACEFRKYSNLKMGVGRRRLFD